MKDGQEGSIAFDCLRITIILCSENERMEPPMALRTRPAELPSFMAQMTDDLSSAPSRARAAGKEAAGGRKGSVGTLHRLVVARKDASSSKQAAPAHYTESNQERGNLKFRHPQDLHRPLRIATEGNLFAQGRRFVPFALPHSPRRLRKLSAPRRHRT